MKIRNFVASLCGAFLCSPIYADTVTRHIYNNSDTTWYIFYNDIRGLEILSAKKGPFGSYVIEPKSIYTTKYHHVKDQLKICDMKQVCHEFYMHKNYIHHYGRTGSVALNRPADGDIRIEKNTW